MANDSSVDMDGPTLLEETSHSFLRAVKNTLGEAKHSEAMEALKGVLGKQWASGLTYHKLANNFSSVERIRFLRHPNGLNSILNNKINAIKCLRGLTGCGLVEAKNAIEKSYDEWVVCALRKDYPLAFGALPPSHSLNGTEASEEELENYLVEQIKALRNFGWSVEIA